MKRLEAALRQVAMGSLMALLAACGGGGGSGSSTPSSSPLLTLKSAEVTSPAPLALENLSTAGLASSGAVTVTYSDGQSYSVTVPALSVSSAGVVSVGVPIYLLNGVPSAGTVQVTVSQGGVSSNALTLSVQNLPALSTYGLTPGQVSSAFMTFETLIQGIRLSELQLVYSENPGLAHLSSALSTVTTLLNGAVTTQSAIATAAGGGTVPIGTDASGGALQLDPTQLALMDQVLLAALQQMVPSVPVVTTAKQLIVGGSGSAHAPVRRIKAAANPSGWWSALKTVLTTSNGAYTLRAYMQGQDSSVGNLQADQAVAEGAAAVTATDENQMIGIPLAITHVYVTLDSTFHTIGAVAACEVAIGCGSQTMSELQAQLTNDGNDMASTVWSALASLNPLTAPGSTLVSTGSGLATFLQNAQSLVTSGKLGEADAVDTAVLSGSTAYSAGLIQGALPVSQQDSIDYCCFGSAQATGVSDAVGDYAVWMPAGVAGANYTSVQLTASDPASGAVVAADTQTVNLTALDQAATNVAGLTPAATGGSTGSGTTYTLSGSVTLSGTGTMTTVTGCTAATITSSGQGIMNATVNGDIQTPGTYTATVSVANFTMTDTSSSTSCTTGGQTVTVPGQTTTETIPSGTSTVTVVSDGTNLTVTGALLGTDPAGCTGGSSATGTVTGLANPLVSLTSTMSCALSGGSSSDTSTVKLVGSW